jgi:hypothetical protein
MDKVPLLSKQEIIDLASRYTAPEEIVDFPGAGDLFCMMQRSSIETPPQGDDEGWKFAGYGLCTGYIIDDLEVPAGKWLWMQFTSLAVFPPLSQALRLQPPHVAKGRFQSQDRGTDFRIRKISPKDIQGETNVDDSPAKKKPEKKTSLGRGTGNIVAFRKKGDAKRT